MSAMGDRLSALMPYVRRLRPGLPASFPSYIDEELRRIDAATADIVATLKAMGPLLDRIDNSPSAV